MEPEREQPTDVKKEMGITHKDFYAELPALLDRIPYQQTEDTIRFQLNGKNMEIIIINESFFNISSTPWISVMNCTICGSSCSIYIASLF